MTRQKVDPNHVAYAAIAFYALSILFGLLVSVAIEQDQSWSTILLRFAACLCFLGVATSLASKAKGER